VAIAAIAYSSLTPEERRHTLQIGVSIGVPGRRVPGLNLLVCHVWMSTDGCRSSLPVRYKQFQFQFQLARVLSGERVLFNPPWELIEYIWHVIIFIVVGVQLQHLRWPCLPYLSGLSSTTSFDTGKCTKNPLLGHNCLLATR
jgi:hypothetical protein